jgi:hypothetical protein
VEIPFSAFNITIRATDAISDRCYLLHDALFIRKNYPLAGQWHISFKFTRNQHLPEYFRTYCAQADIILNETVQL